MIKNAFDYLELSFNKIFCYKGLLLLKSSFIVGFISTILNLLLLIVLFAVIYYSAGGTELTFFIKQAAYIIIIILGILFVGICESAFYAILLPRKFLNVKNQQVDFWLDYQEWTKGFKLYFQYITYFSTLIIGFIILIIICIYLSYISIGGWGVFLGIVFGLWAYIYLLYRSLISWYGMLFGIGNSWNLFWKGWNLLEGKVYFTFKIVFIFTFIVGFAGSIASYVAQMFLPDLTSIIIELSNKIDGIKSSDLTLQEVLGLLREISQTILYPGVYTLIIFSFFYKISSVFQVAMIHSFLTEYYHDVNGDNLLSNQD